MADDIPVSGFFRATEEDTISRLDAFQADGIFQFVAGNMLEAFYNMGAAIMNPDMWLAWLPFINQPMDDMAVKESLMRFMYYGASVEFFFVVFNIFLIVTVIGFLNNRFMWSCVRVLEGFGNTVGRLFAWAGLLMVLQQIVIIFMQRVFAVSEIGMGVWPELCQRRKLVVGRAEAVQCYDCLHVCRLYLYSRGPCASRSDLFCGELSDQAHHRHGWITGSDDPGRRDCLALRLVLFVAAPRCAEPISVRCARASADPRACFALECGNHRVFAQRL